MIGEWLKKQHQQEQRSKLTGSEPTVRITDDLMDTTASSRAMFERMNTAVREEQAILRTTVDANGSATAW